MPIKTVKPDFPYLEFRIRVVEKDGQVIAIGFNKDTQVAQCNGDDIEDAERQVKQELKALSNDFVAIEGAVNVFRRVFPEGYGSPFYDYIEGNYKADASRFVAEQLSKERLSEQISGGRFGDVCADAKRAISKTNLPSQFESMALSDFLKVDANQEPFALGLFDLLYGDDFDLAFTRFTKLLTGKENAAKWPIVTYFPFFRFPDEHVFVKPTLFETCAYRLGYDLSYDPKPNIETYRSCQGLVEMIRDETATLHPRNNIDIQSFMYVVATDGYIARVEEARNEWEEKQANS